MKTITQGTLTVLLLTLAATAWLATACRHTGAADERTPEQVARLKALTDSVDLLVPGAADMIERAMADASDSLDYYDYLQLRSHAYILSTTPDAALPLIGRVVGFTGRQQPSPRLNGLHAAALNTEASYYYLLHIDYDRVINTYRRAYHYAALSDNLEMMPDIEANLADAYIARNDLPTAASHYRHALLLVDSLGLPRRHDITLYMGLANIYTKLEDYDTALSYYTQTDSLFHLMKPNMQSYFLNNYGSCHYLRKDYPQALLVFRRMQRLLEELGQERYFDMYLCKINMADVHLNLGNLREASQLVEEAGAYFADKHIDAGTYYANTIRIGIATRRGDVQQVKDILDTEGDLEQPDFTIANIRDRYLLDYYQQSGQHRLAYHQLKLHLLRNDSAAHNLQNMKSAEIMLRFTQDTLKLHHQLQMDERNAAVYRSRVALWVTISVILILLLTVIVALLYIRKHRLQTQMSVMQLRLENARNRISPHFVFNLLNNSISQASQQEADALMQLARLIRANLDLSSQLVIPLKDELDFVRQYIKVEAPLVGSDFSYTVSTPAAGSGWEQVRVPSMTIQILVENAIVHALKGRQGHKQLDIAVSYGSSGTDVTVSDNGPGFDIRYNGDSRPRNGLRIITRTLQLINQTNRENARIRFDIGNCPEGGCCASIHIPHGIKYTD